MPCRPAWTGTKSSRPTSTAATPDGSTTSTSALLQDTDLLVTCTGNADVCDSAMLRSLKQGAVVCNIGHFDNEIDTQYMRDNWRWDTVKDQVHQVFRSDSDDDFLILLSEGRLVNLGNAMGHPSRVMDGSFANQVLAPDAPLRATLG